MLYNNIKMENKDDNILDVNNSFDLDKVFIYPHSVTVNAEPVYAKEVYNDIYKNCMFSFYLEISLNFLVPN